MNTEDPTQPPSINDPEAWRQVLSDYELGISTSYYLCNNSTIFARWWGTIEVRQSIRQLAKTFAPRHTYHEDNNAAVLFNSSTLRDATACYQLRLDFLNWVINRLTSNAPSSSTTKED